MLIQVCDTRVRKRLRLMNGVPWVGFCSRDFVADKMLPLILTGCGGFFVQDSDSPRPRVASTGKDHLDQIRKIVAVLGNPEEELRAVTAGMCSYTGRPDLQGSLALMWHCIFRGTRYMS